MFDVCNLVEISSAVLIEIFNCVNQQYVTISINNYMLYIVMKIYYGTENKCIDVIDICNSTLLHLCTFRATRILHP